MKNFAFTGAAGHIALRHRKALKDTRNCLIVNLDKRASVVFADSDFPEADFLGAIHETSAR